MKKRPVLPLGGKRDANSLGLKDTAAPREHSVVIAGTERADHYFACAGRRMHKIAAAEIDADVIAGVIIGRIGVEADEIANLQIFHRDLGIIVVVAQLFRRCRQLDSCRFKTIFDVIGAIEAVGRIGAGGVGLQIALLCARNHQINLA